MSICRSQKPRKRNKWTAVGEFEVSMGIAVGDHSHNGLPSLYVTNFADEYNVLYLNQGNYDFRDVSYESGVAVASLPWVKLGRCFRRSRQ